MKVNNKTEAMEFIINKNPNNTDKRYLSHLVQRIPGYPCYIQYCSDEKTGIRFGQAKCRKNLNPIKIGNGGKNPNSLKAYQLWIWKVGSRC